MNTSIVVGDPKDVICDFTSNVKADLLVMGCRAIGPIKRLDVYIAYDMILSNTCKLITSCFLCIL